MGGDFVFNSWRLFILICIIPVVLGLICLFPMPESPRFLLQVGRDLEALAVYRRIYIWNHTKAGAEYEMPEIEIISSKSAMELEKRENFPQKSASAKCHVFLESFFQMFYTPLTAITLLLSVIWFSLSFGYYGVSIWFPEYMKRLEEARYFAQTNHTDNSVIANRAFTTVLNNMEFTNSTFLNVNFTNMEMLHITFGNCFFRGCNFINVTAKQTYITDSVLQNSVFKNTNFYPFKFHETLFDNTSFSDEKEGCQVDFQISYNERTVFLESFISQLAVIPASAFSAFMVDKVGRVKVLVCCLFMSAVSVFFIWFMTTEVAIVCFNAVFSCVTIGAFNAMEIASTELYPTHLRARVCFSTKTIEDINNKLSGYVQYGDTLELVQHDSGQDPDLDFPDTVMFLLDWYKFRPC